MKTTRRTTKKGTILADPTPQRLMAKGRKPYLGQEGRVVLACHNTLTGWKLYALKTATQTLAVSDDKTALIDLAEEYYMTLESIAD